MNKLELAIIMKRYGDTQETLAKAIGISRTRLNAKINETDNASFTQPEICAIKERYQLSDSEINVIFFTRKVS